MLQVNKPAYREKRDAIVAEFADVKKAFAALDFGRDVKLVMMDFEGSIRWFDELLASDGYCLYELNKELADAEKNVRELKAIAVALPNSPITIAPSFMEENIDFKTYRYFYDCGIIRMNKATGQFEHFIRGKFVETELSTNIETRLADAYDDISELREGVPREVELLYEELSRGKTIK